MSDDKPVEGVGYVRPVVNPDRPCLIGETVRGAITLEWCRDEHIGTWWTLRDPADRRRVIELEARHVRDLHVLLGNVLAVLDQDSGEVDDG